ncbi:MAG: phospholipase D-like domain-containing protein [Nanopusillaceae archaeon]
MKVRSLFDEDKKINYLNIIYNDDIYDEDITKLLDNKEYDYFCAISYVSSYVYTLDILTKFDKAILILGEEDTAGKFFSLNIDEEERIIKDLKNNNAYVEKLKSGSLEIRYILGGKRVHSKIYFLEGKEKSLVLVGSANITRTAFSNNTQFEEIIAYDSTYNPKIVQLYKERMKYLYSFSTKDISEKILQKVEEINKKSITINNTKAEIQNINSSIISNRNSSITIENIESSTIVASKDSIININTGKPDIIYTEDEKVDRIIEMVKNNAKSNIMNISEILNRIEEEKKENQQRVIELQQIEKIIENTTKKTKEGIVFKPVKDLQSKKDKLLKEIAKVKGSKKDELLSQRNVLIYNTKEDMLYKEIGDTDGTQNAIPYGQLIEKQTLRKALDKMSNFVKSYSLFSQGNVSNKTSERVFEAILFAFTSPFIHLFRADIYKEKSPEKVAEIPIVMILGGEANTGKTKLLNTINQLIGNSFPVFSYGNLYTKNQTWMNIVFESNNVFPVLVDEFESTFFRGIGERQIKHYTNTLITPSPCLIGTSNISFSVESQVVRRIYYLHFDNSFPEDKKIKAEADIYFEKNVGEMDDTVFKHFVYLFLKHVREGEELYKDYDPLFLSRKILKSMYVYAGLEEPEDFPVKPYGDYYKRGSIEWHGFYIANKERFREMKDNDELYYVIEMTDINPKIITEMKSRLPPSILKSGGVPLIVHKELFLKFIGIKERKTIFKKFFPFI